MSLSLLALDTMVCTVFVGSCGCWYVHQDRRKVLKSEGGGSRNKKSFNVTVQCIFYFFENPREGDWFRWPFFWYEAIALYAYLGLYSHYDGK